MEKIARELNRLMLEKKLYTLSADAMLVMSRVARGETNHEIVEWSKGWKFSEQQISKHLTEIYAMFSLTHLSPKKAREHAGKIMREIFAERNIKWGVADKAPSKKIRRIPPQHKPTNEGVCHER